jgi:hypothetical protein
MPEHLIRLRAAWEGEFPNPQDGTRQRIDLPTLWRPAPSGPFRIRRRFQAPRLGADEEVRLRLLYVPGLAAVRLNGQALDFDREVALEGLRPGPNELVLDVDPREWAAEVAAGGISWGEVVLVIRTRDPEVIGGPGGEAL